MVRRPRKKGILAVLTGNGKGKTTSAMGQILRALGRGQKVCLIQLFKGKNFYGEQKVLTRLPGLDFHSFAPKHPYCFKEVPLSLVKRQCADALACLERIAHGRKKYGLVVLEEFNIAQREGLLDVNVLLELVRKLTATSNVIFTGRGAPQPLIDAADLVTEMREVKHPYSKGVPACKGWEF